MANDDKETAERYEQLKKRLAEKNKKYGKSKAAEADSLEIEIHMPELPAFFRLPDYIEETSLSIDALELAMDYIDSLEDSLTATRAVEKLLKELGKRKTVSGSDIVKLLRCYKEQSKSKTAAKHKELLFLQEIIPNYPADADFSGFLISEATDLITFFGRHVGEKPTAEDREKAAEAATERKKGIEAKIKAIEAKQQHFPNNTKLAEEKEKLTAELENAGETATLYDIYFSDLLLADIVQCLKEGLDFVKQASPEQYIKLWTEIRALVSNREELLVFASKVAEEREKQKKAEQKAEKDRLEHFETSLPEDRITTVDKARKIMFDTEKQEGVYMPNGMPAALDNPAYITVADNPKTYIKAGLQEPDPDEKTPFDEVQALAKIGIVKGVGRLTAFDGLVFDALATFINEGQMEVTLSALHKVIEGNSEARLTDQSTRKLVESLSRLMGTIIVVFDDTEEAKLQDRTPITASMENFIYAKVLSKAVVNNSISEGVIKFIEVPTLLKYAQATKRIQHTNFEQLETGKRKAERSLTVQDYIIKRVNEIKQGLTKTIKLEPLYKYVGLEELNSPKPRTEEEKKAYEKERNKLKAKQLKAREDARVVLQQLKDRHDIKDFEFKRKGKAYYSIVITLNKKVRVNKC